MEDAIASSGGGSVAYRQKYFGVSSAKKTAERQLAEWQKPAKLFCVFSVESRSYDGPEETIIN